LDYAPDKCEAHDEKMGDHRRLECGDVAALYGSRLLDTIFHWIWTQLNTVFTLFHCKKAFRLSGKAYKRAKAISRKSRERLPKE
jgi:hypothetical protein